MIKTEKPYRPASVLLLALSLLLAACGNGTAASSIRLRKAEGTVRVSDDKDKKVEARENLKLYDGYGVRTKSESYAWVTLDSVKLTKLDQLSDAEIRKSGDKLKINVNEGSLFFHITEPLEEDESLEIRTSTLAIGIRGTCGWVETSEDGKTGRVYIIEGKVECSAMGNGTAGGQSVFVTAGETASLTEGGVITVETFDPAAIPSFVQDEADEDEILEQILQEVAASGWPEDTTGYGEDFGQGGQETPAGTNVPTGGGTSAPQTVFVPWSEAGLEDREVNWPWTDDRLVSCSSNNIAKTLTSPVRLSDIWEITSLHLSYLHVGRGSGIPIVDISVLGEMKNLTTLFLYENPYSAKGAIDDISALSGLTNLTELRISDCNISDISALSGLTNLTKLYISGRTIGKSDISDISALSGLTNLTELQITGCGISDISALSGLTNLTHLYLWSNNISDVSALQNLSNLQTLSLEGNPVTDYSPVDFVPNLTK